MISSISNKKKTGSYNMIKAGFWYTFGNILIKGIPFLSLPVFTRLLSTSEFGLFNTYLSYEGIISVIICLGLSGTIKTAKFEFKKQFESYVSSILVLQLLIFTLFFIVTNLFGGFISSQTGFSQGTINLLLVNSLATATISIITCKLVIDGDYKKNLFISFGVTLLNIGISLVLCYVIFDKERQFARIWGTAISAVVISVMILVRQLTAKWKLEKKFIHFGLRMGIPLMPHLLSVTLLSQCDKIMIQTIVGNSEAGIYSVAVNLMTILMVVMMSLENAWSPWFYSNLDEKNYSDLKNTNKLFVYFFMILTMGFILISPDLIKLMSAKSYWAAIDVLLPLTISVFVNFMYLFAVNLEYFYKKTWFISIGTIISAVINIVLNYIFIKQWGYIGAAYATTISKLILFVMHHYRADSLSDEKAVELNVLVKAFLAVLVTAIFCSYFKDVYLVRYILILLILVVFAFTGRKYLQGRKRKI